MKKLQVFLKSPPIIKHPPSPLPSQLNWQVKIHCRSQRGTYYMPTSFLPSFLSVKLLPPHSVSRCQWELPSSLPRPPPPLRPNGTWHGWRTLSACGVELWSGVGDMENANAIQQQKERKRGKEDFRIDKESSVLLHLRLRARPRPGYPDRKLCID